MSLRISISKDIIVLFHLQSLIPTVYSLLQILVPKEKGVMEVFSVTVISERAIFFFLFVSISDVGD